MIKEFDVAELAVKPAMPQWNDQRIDPELAMHVDTIHGEAVVFIAKAGGGTVGKSHAGDWYVEVQFESVGYFETLTTGLPRTHRGAAGEAAHMIVENYVNGAENGAAWLAAWLAEQSA